jgi:hypothetical protein
VTAVDVERTVLTSYTKVVCHLHHALQVSSKMGLILGAGVSNELHVPGWSRLLDAVEQKILFDGKIPKAPESYRGEQLYQFFRMERTRQLNWAQRGITEAEVNADWRIIVSEILYDKYLVNGEVHQDRFREAIEAHPYLRALARVARQLELVITHNFDNALEWTIITEPGGDRRENRRCHPFWRPEPFLRPGMLNVYHPNGFIPITGLKGSENIVLTESNFADLLANPNDAESHFLLSHLSYKTWLIIGHSLADATLKNALRLHTIRRPGHVNYFVHWLRDDEVLPHRQMEAIREANFSTYNLVTLFLTSREIGALLRLIDKSPDDLRSELSAAELPSRYVYYICGPVSSGKSTILSHLRSIATVEEWPDRMPAAMNQPSTQLNATQEEEIDGKLEDAIWRKNEEINKFSVGLVAVDRAPLDFIAFPGTPEESPLEVARKRHTRVLLRFERDNFKYLCDGQVILVQGRAETLLERQIQRGRQRDEEELRSDKALHYLTRQSELMDQIYTGAIKDSCVRGDGCSLVGCLQDVMRIIHFKDYRPFDFAKRLRDYIEGDP